MKPNELVTHSKPIEILEAEKDAKKLMLQLERGLLDTKDMPDKKIKAIKDGLIVNKIVIHQDGSMWYHGPWGNAQRYDTIIKRNRNRMYVNGQYIPKTHPFHTQGRYIWNSDAFDSFSQLSDIELVDCDTNGEVYIITNPIFEGWVKVGMATDSHKRLKDYYTYTPQNKNESYQLAHTISVANRMVAESEIHNILESESLRNREWFQITTNRAKEILNEYVASRA